MNSYDKVVGIGYNCEVSFRLRNYFGKIDAQLFSWSLIYDREKFLDAFVHPEKIYSKEMILNDNDMFECAVTAVSFHPRHEVLSDESRDKDERTQWCKDELLQRVNHLKEKHRNLFSGNYRTLFILKVKPENEEADSAFITDVYRMISDMYKSGSFTLVAILPKKQMTDRIRNLENENLKIRSLRWYPPQKHTDIASDSASWAKILCEFCGGDKKAFLKRERQQRRKALPGMIINKIKNTLGRKHK